MEEAREACFHCREAIALDAKVCPHCRREVLADVHLQSAITDGRLRYKLARSLSAQSDLPLPPFATLQQALGARQPIVARRLTRAAADRVVEALAAEGIESRIEVAGAVAPARAASASARAGLPLGAVAWALVAVAALAGAAWYGWRSARVPQAVRSPAPIVAAPRPAVVVEQTPALTTRQIADMGLPSTVSLRCQNSIASGFFVAPGTILTNAHALCPQGGVRVVLSDGRQAAGVTGLVDRTLDLATITVFDLRGQAVPLGDAGALAVGDKVVMIGSPLGLEFTVHEGTVSSLSRGIDGVAFIQLDAKVNPGNSGGPLFDARGRVVGVVSRKLTQAEGIALALPINYAYRSVAPATQLAAGEVSSEGFEAMVARAKVGQINERPQAGWPLPDRGLPMMAAVEGDRRTREMLVTVVLPAQVRPDYRKLSFDVMVGDEVLCTVESEVYEWTLLEGNKALGRIHPKDLPGIRRRAELGTLYLGEARVSVSRCPMERLRWGRKLRLVGADPEFAEAS